MDVYKILENDGTKLVPNPKYNPRAKKNPQPKQIRVPDDKAEYSPVVDLAVKGGLQQQSIDAKAFEKYHDAGLTWNPTKDFEYYDRYLSNHQSNWTKAGNALAQTVVNEIGLGTLKGISDLFDMTIGAGFRKLTGEENDYSNPISKTLEEWQEAFKNYAPIHTTPGVDIWNGGLTDFGWWANNAPSVMSSLTLLIPSTGVTKGLSWLGKASGATKLVGNGRRFLTGINKIDKIEDAAAAVGKTAELNAAQRFSKWANRKSVVDRANRMVEHGINGFTSRLIENYQEASQVYNDLLPQMLNGDPTRGIKGINDMSDEEYNNLIERNTDILQDVDTSNREEVAKALAKAGADRTFKLDLVNGLFDVYELYGLRNIKAFKNGPMRASIRRAHLNSMKYPTKSAEEIKELLKNRSKFVKAKEKLGDWAFGSRREIAAQLSEGIEEGINYIAQEEGMNYGNALLADAPQSSFDTRLKNYMNSPQLYESAFWGVLGGVVFQAGGSKLAQLDHAREVRHNEKKYALNEQTMEQQKKVDWHNAFELPEITARKNNIEARAIGLEVLKGELEQIEDDINPFVVEGDTNKKLKSDEEKEIARDIAYRKYATSLLMDAMFCGNWDITRHFLESDEVRDALVQSGILSQDEATRRQYEVAQLAEELEESYDRNMRVMENVMRGNVNGIDLDNTPVEYLQIIAAENMRHELDAKQYARNVDQYRPIIASEEERLAEELNANGIDYKTTIASFILAQNLGQINAELEAARKSKREGRSKDFDARTISGQTAIRELELRKQVLENMISKLYKPLDSAGLTGDDKKSVDAANKLANKLNGAATTLVTLRAVAATVANPEGGYNMDTETERYKKLDEVITKAFSYTNDGLSGSWAEHQKALSKLDESLGKLSSDEFKQVARLADTFNENVARVIGENSVAENLNNLSQKLLTAYAAVQNNEMMRQIELAQIVKRRGDVLTAIHNKHNELQSARMAILDVANNTLKGIAKKYYEEYGDISKLLANASINSDAREQLKNILNEEDLKSYDEAMFIMSLEYKDKKGRTQRSVPNALLPEMIQDALYESSRDEFEDYDEEMDKRIKEAREAAKAAPKEEDKTKEKSTKSEKRKSDKKKDSEDSSKGEEKKPDTGKKKPKIVDFTFSRSGNKLAQPRAAIYLNDDGTISHFGQSGLDPDVAALVNLIPIEGQPGAYALDFINELKNEGISETNPIFTNDNLFKVKRGIIDGGEIVKNPIVVINEDGTLDGLPKPGVIDNPTSVDEVEEGESEGETSGGEEAPISSTGGVTPEEDNDDDTDTPGGEGAIEEMIEASDVFSKAIKHIKRRKNLGEEFTDQDIYNDLVEEFKDASERGLKDAIARTKKQIKKAIVKLEANVKEVDTLFDFIELSSISDKDTGSDETSKDREALEDVFDQLVENFAKRAVVDDHNGRSILSLENLLRYCNELAEDKKMADLLYDKFVQIIKDNDHKYKLVESYTYGDNLDRDEIVGNSEKTEQERYDELEHPNGRDIDSWYILDKIEDPAEREKIYDTLDALKPGETLNIRREEMYNPDGTPSGRDTIYFSKDGVDIASIPTPEITPTGYKQITKYWIVDIPRANDGTQSKLEQLFVQMILNPNNDPRFEVIADAIRQAHYTPHKHRKGRYKGQYTKAYIDACRHIYDLLEKVVNLNDYVDFSSKRKAGTAFEDTLDGKIHMLIDHVVGIYSGVKINSEQWLAASGLTQKEYDESLMERRKDSIHRWFKRLKDSYDSVMELSSNADTSVVVDTVNQGGAIIVPRSEAKPVNAKGVIGTAHKDKLNLVVASITEAGKVYSTDGNTLTMGAMRPGSTFLSIPHNSGTPALIHAYPQAIGAKHITGPVKQLQKEIIKELERRLEAWATDRNTTVDEIEDYLLTLCSSKGGNNALLFGFEVTRLTNDFNGIQIAYKDSDNNQHYIKLFDTDERGNKRSTIQFDREDGHERRKNDKERKAMIDRILDAARENLKFRLEFDYIKGTRSLSGYAKRGTKGQFIVQVPGGKVHTFKSYKDFIINNGLIAVTTKSNNGKTNYYRPGESNDKKDNPRVTYKLGNKVEEPAHRENAPSRAEIAATVAKGDTVKDMIESHGSENDIIKRILATLLSDERLQILRESKLLDELFSGTIKFGELNDPNAFGGHIKEDTSHKGVQYKKGDIVMTPIWIEYLNSGDTAKIDEAIRHLIHETIHRKLKTLPSVKYNTLMKEIKSIQNEFIAANEAEGLIAGTGIRILEGISTEEFLVESLTRPTLIRRLNSISTGGETIQTEQLGDVKAKTLLQRIISAIAKMFGLNINKGSLLAKEYKLFETLGLTNTTTETNAASSTNTNVEFKTPEQEASFNAVEQLVQFSNDNIVFDKEEHKYSVLGVPTTYSVTGYVSKIFGSSRVLDDYSHSTAIGNSYDAIWRDYFSGEDVLSKTYPNFNERRVKQVIEDCERFKQYIANRFGEGCIIKTKEFYITGTINDPVNGNSTVAGAIDMMVIAPNGDIHIFDMKAKNHDIDTKYNGKLGDDKRDYTAQQNIYRSMIESNPGLEGKVKSINLIWGSTSYPKDPNKFSTDEDGNVIYDDNGEDVKLEDLDRFATPRLKPDINESIIPLEITDVVNNTEGKSQNKKLTVPVFESRISNNDNVDTEGTTDVEGDEGDTNDFYDEDLANKDFDDVDPEFEDEDDYSTISDVDVTYTQEMKDIKATAIANGTFMKAPNGQPTKLNERQWLQVRTKAFIDWFGDWINDPDNASKVIDDDGENATFEPLVVYHHSPNKFTKFRNTAHGQFFTDNENHSKTFGPNKYAVFLNIKNPYIMENREVGASAVQYEFEDNKNIDGVLGYSIINYRTKEQVNEFVTRNPNQIKSATNNNGDFSTEDDDINYSSISDHEVVSVAQVRDRIIPENRKTFEHLIKTAAIQINC